MYMHAIYKIREFLFYKGFNLIKVDFQSEYAIVHVYVINCQVISVDTSGSYGCEILIWRQL